MPGGGEASPGSWHLHALGAQHLRERDERQPDERRGVASAQAREERDAQALALGAARAVERGFPGEIALDLRGIEAAEGDVRRDDPRALASRRRVQQDEARMEERLAARELRELRASLLEGAGL